MSTPQTPVHLPKKGIVAKLERAHASTIAGLIHQINCNRWSKDGVLFVETRGGTVVFLGLVNGKT